MGEIGPWQIVVVLLLALLFFGPQKLGDLGGGLGKGIRNFKKGLSGPEPPRRKKKKKKRPQPELEAEPEPVAELDEPAPAQQSAATQHDA